ncbi:hypothetical protein BJX63DRAFT_433187 [Aspergillus granulosus]|uniref:Uncharacterized protein n=1 Tax=Aspergillus granulosus TaxID=176169 RepID=A0ABR4H8A9_9EURO
MDGFEGVPCVPIEDWLSSFASIDGTRDELPSFFYATFPRSPVPHGCPFQAHVEDADEPPAYEKFPRNAAITTLLDPAPIQAARFPPGIQVNELNQTCQGDHGIISGSPSNDPSAPERPISRASTVSTEPFPGIDAIEVRPPSLVYRCQEEAYEYALTKLAEELVNVRGTPTAAAGLTGPNFSTDQERLPNGPSMVTVQSVSPYSTLSHHDHFCPLHEKQKLRIRKKIYCTLRYSKDIPTHFQKRFTALANMVIDMEFIFFREHHFPTEPLRFVTLEGLEKVRYYGTEMLRYLSRLGTTLNQSKITALSSQCLVSQVAARTELTALGRFQKMAEIFLNKTRTFEQEFFELFSKFYNGFFFDDFHIMYNNYLVKKPESEPVPPILVDVSYHLNSVYRILNRLLDDYRILKDANIDIGDKYLQPALEDLTRDPGIWEQCVRASNPENVCQSGLEPSPIIHYTEPRPMRHLSSGHIESQVQSIYTPSTESRASPVRIVDSPGTQLRSTQTSYTEGRRSPVRVADSPDTQHRLAQLSYTQDQRAPEHMVDFPETQSQLAHPSQQQSYRSQGHPYGLQQSVTDSANTSFTKRHQSHSPILRSDTIDVYKHRVPFTESSCLQSQNVDPDTVQAHQAQPARPQSHESIHHPQPRRCHPFKFIQDHDAQRTVESHQVRHHFAGPGIFGIHTPPLVYVEQIRPSEARYIHSMVQIIRGERHHSPGRWGRARLMSHTPEYESHALPFHRPFFRTQHAQPQQYNPGDHVHCHQPHFHVADNGRSHLPPLD